mgnify:CR=1 FL=1
MKLNQFKFKMPEGLMAQFPTRYRDDARMMVVHKKGAKAEHRSVKDLPEYFEEGDMLVMNNTKVFPARLYAEKEKTKR